jgi:hypothetical protein
MLGVCIERFSYAVKAGASRHVTGNKDYKPDYVRLCTYKVFRINIKLQILETGSLLKLQRHNDMCQLY